MPLIDSHCHLDFEDFDHDRQQVIQHCMAQGITHIIVPGVTRDSWPRLLDVCEQHQILKPTLGLHPMFMLQHQDSDLEALQQVIEQTHPLAIGEIGLDFFLPGQDKQAQIRLFEAQIRLAEQFDLPVILHVRKAHDEVLKVLRQSHVKGGIVHAFNGSLQQAEHYMKQGFLFGVGGALTYPRAQKLRALFTTLPLDHIVLETDAPDMPLAGHQGQRNSPEKIPDIRDTLAELREQTSAEIAATTTANCQRLFNLL